MSETTATSPATSVTTAPPAPGLQPDAVVIRDRSRTVLGTLRECWHARHAAGWLLLSATVSFYANTLLGRFWVVFRPAFNVLGKALIFGGVLNATSNNGTPYFLFVLTGMALFGLVDRGLIKGMKAMNTATKWARKINFPLVLAVPAATVQGLMEYGMYSIVFVPTVLFYWLTRGHLYLTIGPQLLLAPLALVITLTLTIGAACWLSVLNWRAADVRLIMRQVIGFGVLVTPVIYPLSDLHGPLRTIALLNPLAAPVEMYKYALIGAGRISLLSIAYSAVVAVVLFFTGVWYVNRSTPELLAGTAAGGEDDGDDMA
jgi:ABC-type polysaccharide/polyol phosphate export permease